MTNKERDELLESCRFAAKRAWSMNTFAKEDEDFLEAYDDVIGVILKNIQDAQEKEQEEEDQEEIEKYGSDEDQVADTYNSSRGV